MEENRRKAYVKLMYYVFLDIRNISSLDSINPKKLKSSITKINHLADAFHNLPELIYSSHFDEKLFWEQLKIVCPDNVESYMGIFESALNSLGYDSTMITG